MNFKILNLLIVAENALFSEALTAQLQQGEGFDVKSLGINDLPMTGAELFHGLDLVILCGAHPADAETLLRSKSYHGPILHLASPQDSDAHQDVMHLPVRVPALLQKVRSLAQSFWFRDDLTIALGALSLRPAFKELCRQGEQPVALTDKEVEILIYLFRAGGKIISRDVLLAEVWGYNADVSTHTLETHIYRLRQKIETEPEGNGLLMTEPGGYRLNLTGGE